MIAKEESILTVILKLIGCAILLYAGVYFLLFLMPQLAIDTLGNALEIEKQAKYQKINDWCDEIDMASECIGEIPLKSSLAEDYNISVQDTYKSIANSYFGTNDVKEAVIRVNDVFTDYYILCEYADTKNETYVTIREETKLELLASIRYLKDLTSTDNTSET